MCGFAGMVSLYAQSWPANAQQAVNCLRHRGPQKQQTWSNAKQNVFFGHNRLSIIDLSEAATQPLHYAHRYSIMHNGELYNYAELKKQLIQKGFHFTTQSDTEVIAAAYMAWGPACLQQFDGMFAFAIWDEATQRLFAARDRMGEKPFFFFYEEQKLVFASEMKALWHLGVPRQENRSMLYNFLTIGYTGNPADPSETFFEGVQKLPAATFLIFDLPKKELKLEKYWQPQINVRENSSQEEAIEEFHSLFTESISLRLRSDVPVGTSLSGGLDSSAVVASCEKQKADNYTHKCFTIGFDDFERDEKKYAELVAKKFGLQHFTTTLTAGELPQLMQTVMYHQEEPFLSASVLAQYKIYELAKQQGVTVLLDGQGADEVLGGYHKYYKWYWQELYRNGKLKSSGERLRAMDLGVQEKFTILNKAAALVPEFAAGMLQSRKGKQAFKNQELNRDFAFSNKQNLYYTTPATFDLNGALYFNSFVYGLEELLRLADRNSMAHGREVRLPFLSHRLVEFLFTLPPQLKIHEGWTKWLLRKTVENELPPEIVWRRDKVGLEPPQKSWMQDSSVQAAIREGQKKLVAEHILNKSVLERNVEPKDAHDTGSRDWRYWSASYLFQLPA